MSDQANIHHVHVVDPADADPIFAALLCEQRAFQAFSDALTALARAGGYSLDLRADAAQRERFLAIEMAEARASAALIEAERALLTTKPTTIQGATALLAFLRRHLGEDPDIEPVIHAMGNIEAVFGESGTASDLGVARAAGC